MFVHSARPTVKYHVDDALLVALHLQSVPLQLFLEQFRFTVHLVDSLSPATISSDQHAALPFMQGIRHDNTPLSLS